MAYVEADGALGTAVGHDPLFGPTTERLRRVLACDLTDLATMCREKGLVGVSDWRRIKPGASESAVGRSFDRFLSRMRSVEGSLPEALKLRISLCVADEHERGGLGANRLRNQVSFLHGIPNAAQIEDLLRLPQQE